MRKNLIHDDGPSCKCGAVLSDSVTCDRCGCVGVIADCGCMVQPRPIAAGLSDGTEMHRTYCYLCEQELAAATTGNP